MRREYFRFGFPLPRYYRVGPLSDYLDEYVACLRDRQYSRDSARSKIRIVVDLSRWLKHRGLGVKDLNEERIAEFFHRRKRQRRDSMRCGDQAAARLFLRSLRDRGVLPEPPPRAEPFRDPTEVAFEQYLREERGVSQALVLNWVPYVHRFLAERFPAGPPSLSEVSADDITQFVLRSAATMSGARSQLLAGALRSYLRWLYMRGEIAIDLAGAVPTVLRRQRTDIPRYIEPKQVEKLLKSVNRRTATGRRDYAVLLLIARLGLRQCEVARLSLDDIDWDAGEILVHGKGGRSDRLPIPKDVGEALAKYLRDGRPTCATRRVFVTSRAPIRPLALQGAVNAIVTRALSRSGIPSPQKGPYLLRHSLAVRMLQQGASLGEIGEILRHRRLDTTAIYAKVDLNALRALAQPWPGGGR
jgi:site-specific recombinase XerD